MEPCGTLVMTLLILEYRLLRQSRSCFVTGCLSEKRVEYLFLVVSLVLCQTESKAFSKSSRIS